MNTDKKPIGSVDSLDGRRVLILASGSIAVIKTPILISSLIKAGAEVRCAITQSASKLVSSLSISTLSRNHCYQDVDQWDRNQTKPLHISLAEWAEVIVIAPLSASSLARWRYGLAEGLVASILIACEKPIIAVPGMNTGMWNNPGVKSNWDSIERLKNVIRLEPSTGLLACDRFGNGRMADIEIIELAIRSTLITSKQDWQNKRILVSAGPTIEKLDPARIISNRSSGLMGVMLAQAARFRGAIVDLIHGPLQLPQAWLGGLNTFPVKSAQQMQEALFKMHSYADVIAMAAAITDLRKKNGSDSQKIAKATLLNQISNDLELVPDLLSEIASRRRRKHQILLGFAAVTGNDKEIKEIGESKRIQKGCDLLIANPIDRPDQGIEQKSNGGFLLSPGGSIKELTVKSKLELAHQLLDEIQNFSKNVSLN